MDLDINYNTCKNTEVYLKLAFLSVGTARDMMFRDELSRPEGDLAAVII